MLLIHSIISVFSLKQMWNYCTKTLSNTWKLRFIRKEKTRQGENIRAKTFRWNKIHVCFHSLRANGKNPQQFSLNLTGKTFITFTSIIRDNLKPSHSIQPNIAILFSIACLQGILFLNKISKKESPDIHSLTRSSPPLPRLLES